MADLWETIATERRRLADDLDQLSPEQWQTQSRCEAWNVHHAATHLLMPFHTSTPAFFGGLIKHGFNFNKFAIARTAELASEMSADQVVQGLRDHADNKWTPPVPRAGAEIPLSEVVVHGQDIRNALGLECTIPAETIELALAGIKNAKVNADYRARIAG